MCELFHGVDDPHRPPTENVRWSDQRREPDTQRNLLSLAQRPCSPMWWLRYLPLPTQRRKAFPVFCYVDRVRRCACDWHTSEFQRARQTERRLPAKLDNHRYRFLHFDDCEDVLRCQWFEIQPITRVVVGRNRLRVAVDHHRLVTGFRDRKRCVDTAVVELDTLADTVRTRAEHEHRTVARVRRFGLLLKGRVKVRRLCCELGRTRIDGLVGHSNSCDLARMQHLRF